LLVRGLLVQSDADRRFGTSLAQRHCARARITFALHHARRNERGCREHVPQSHIALGILLDRSNCFVAEQIGQLALVIVIVCGKFARAVAYAHRAILANQLLLPRSHAFGFPSRLHSASIDDMLLLLHGWLSRSQALELGQRMRIRNGRSELSLVVALLDVLLQHEQ
jgi:hypothetical protein